MPVLTWDQVAAVAIKAGWPPGPAVIAVAITMPESGRNSTIVQAGQPYATTGWGLWQITPGDSVPRFGINKQLLDPLNNARAGHYKWEEAGGFSPWTTYMNHLEEPYIPAAEAAVQHVTHLSKKRLDQLLAAARAGDGAESGTPGAPDWSRQVRKSSDHLRVASHHLLTYGRHVSRLHPGLRPPAVRVPDPAGLLWQPGKGEPLP